jgi:hypothetical protein
MAVAIPLVAAAGKSAATAAVTSAAIGAGTQLAGGYLAGRGQSNAQKAQLKANQDAMNYERQRQADIQRRQAAYNEEYKKSWLDWYGRVGDEGLKRFGAPPVGIRIPGANAAPPTRGGAVRMEGSASPVAPVPGAIAAPGASAMSGGGGVPPMVPMAQPQPVAQAVPQPGQPAGSLGGWQDWTQYGA